MSPICLIVAGVVRATLPDADFTLAWDHSVQKTRWEEHYRAVDSALLLVEARVQGSGAGMEPPADAVLRDGWWTWRPRTRLTELRLTRSAFARDYMVCTTRRCSELGSLVGATNDGDVVVVRLCTPGDAKGSGSAR